MMRNQDRTKIARILYGGLCAALLLLMLPQGATAQLDWLKKGQELIDGRMTEPTSTALGAPQIDAGLKEALRVGSDRVVGRLGTVDGFNTDPAIHIPLPASLERVRAALSTVGMSGMLDDLEVRLNRAAEVATPKAKELFLQSIEQMTVDDVMGIYNGPEDAATRYFEGKMRSPLAKEMRPVIDKCLAQVGAVQSYNAVMGEYRSLPFVPDVKADLNNHVVQKGMDGIFHYLAQEEAAIRRDPAKRTTELLQQVFGAR